MNQNKMKRLFFLTNENLKENTKTMALSKFVKIANNILTGTIVSNSSEADWNYKQNTQEKHKPQKDRNFMVTKWIKWVIL